VEFITNKCREPWASSEEFIEDVVQSTVLKNTHGQQVWEGTIAGKEAKGCALCLEERA
jgi:hypothetical protein